MQFKTVTAFGLGVLLGILVAPKKGSETCKDIQAKANELYEQSKNITLQDVQDKIEDIKIEISKLDYNKSKELVVQGLNNLKEQLFNLVDYLQENKNIKPSLEGAFDKTEAAAVNLINYIDEKEIVEKTKEKAGAIKNKTGEYFEVAKEKASDIAQKTGDKASEIAKKTGDKAIEIAKKTSDKASEITGKAKLETDEKLKEANEKIGEKLDEKIKSDKK